MPTKEQQRARLIDLLKELFQLNQPELDFGFYRIMHAKAKEVTRFLENDLLAVVEQSFGQASDTRLAELKNAYEAAVAQARSFGAPNPEETAPVKQAKAALEAAADTSRAEAEVYDHLYRFFERYYDNGDFLSRRYLSRETAGRAAPYAVPYNGEEVKLHWANADQYYIKTTEYFTDYSFRLGEEDGAPRVHFRIVDATEGEHGNIKASGEQKRFFILKAADFVAVEDGELVIRFEYRPDPEKTGQENRWQETRNTQAEKAVLAAIETLAGAADFHRRLKVPAPTDRLRDRTILGRYISQYTSRNTMDYFIHKDLGGFLRRELDFYIKNEVMRLDDIESADAPRAEEYLVKIKVLRSIAGKLIDFLTQLENFQKKLWLKKKFVVETNYCITLDRILAIENGKTREWLLEQIVANEAQRNEWVRLFAIDQIDEDLSGQVAYSQPLSRRFLQANSLLLLDTHFFSREFCDSLLDALGDISDSSDGLLMQSDNIDALHLLVARYRDDVEAVYADPPYNADATPILYKNEFRHSSWLAMMYDRMRACRLLLSEAGVACVTIDDYELPQLLLLMDSIFSHDSHLGTIVIRNNPSGRSTVRGFSVNHEYGLFYAGGGNPQIGRLPHSEEQRSRYSETDASGQNFEWENFRKSSAGSRRADRPKQFFPFYIDKESQSLRIPQMSWHEQSRSWHVEEDMRLGETTIWPVDTDGSDRVWRYGVEKAQRQMADFTVREVRGRLEVYTPKYLQSQGILPRTWWDKPDYSARDNGTRALVNLFGSSKSFDFPKAPEAVRDCLRITPLGVDGVVIDPFAGSGTTGQAVITLNREDDGERKYILIEMGSHFDSVLKPRVQKVLYSSDWRDGKPLSCDNGISHMFKYIRLESYEDCLNNLELKDDATRQQLLEQNAGMREGYMLRYMLDVETRGSQSLLNIDAFADPTAYKLKVKKPGSDEYDWRNVDLIETFNWLIGLRVEHIAAPQSFAGAFKREVDPELPQDQNTRLVLDGRMRQDASGPWWFRKVEGWVPDGSGGREKVLIVWRKLTGELEKDNAMLDAWFEANRISTQDWEFDTIYVNGSNNLPNLKREGDNWKVRLIEEDFHKLMWDMEEA